MLPSSFDFASQFEHNRSALLNELTRGIEEALIPFQIALDGFLAGLSRDVLPSNWREEWEAFVIEQQTQGFTVDPTSVEEMEAWIESWAKEFDLWPEEVQAFEDDDFDFEESYFIVTVIPDVSGPDGGKNPKTIVKVVTKTHLPAAHRGKWVQGVRGDGVFQFSNSIENRTAGIAGMKVRFRQQYIAVGGLPSEAYYQNDASIASVELDDPKGTRADNRAADAKMRKKLGNPNWRRPTGYLWNHAGLPGSRIVELVKAKIHRAIAHKAYVAELRAAHRVPNARGRSARALVVLDVYLAVRDGLQAAGHLHPNYEVTSRMIYHFTADDGSTFIVWPGGWWSGAQIEFVAGPRSGQFEPITKSQVERFRHQGEAEWGRYVPGGLFHEPKFNPGSKRERIPYYENDNYGLEREVGWIDKDGVHRYVLPLPPKA